MGLVSLTKYIDELEVAENDYSDRPEIVNVRSAEYAELFPLPYLYELDSRNEYVHKIAKLFKPQISYGFNPWSHSRGDNMLNDINITFLEELVRNTLNFNAFSLQPPYHHLGMPRRVGVFERDVN